jgi:23S rRNA (uracil1939-C5)-methyltransferase
MNEEICKFCDRCGGCTNKDLSLGDYREEKFNRFKNIINQLETDVKINEPEYIDYYTRRRASFAFLNKRGKFILGFNEEKSKSLVEIDKCLLLTNKINDSLDEIKNIAKEICSIPIQIKKKKKFFTEFVTKGDVFVTDADNGLDIVIEFDKELNLEMRQVLFELAQNSDNIIRISHRISAFSKSEPIIEKIKPIIKISGYDILIPAGTFLQPSKEGETTLIKNVLNYIEGAEGNILDLFCGLGTFSYPLAKLNSKNRIFAYDSSKDLLDGFQKSINKNMISNIFPKAKNLFKDPLEGKELENFEAIVIDPPRAGAIEQVKKIAELSNENKIKKIVYVSCNPHSFTRDAKILIENGYKLKEITFVDQFVNSQHFELVSYFEFEC